MYQERPVGQQETQCAYTCIERTWTAKLTRSSLGELVVSPQQMRWLYGTDHAGNFARLLLLDYSKAVDLVNHNILISKLLNIGDFPGNRDYPGKSLRLAGIHDFLGK